MVTYQELYFWMWLDVARFMANCCDPKTSRKNKNAQDRINHRIILPHWHCEEDTNDVE